MFQQCLVTSEFPLAAKAARRRPRKRWQRQEILRRRRDRGIMPWNVAEDVAEGGAGGEICVGLAQGTANFLDDLGWYGLCLNLRVDIIFNSFIYNYLYIYIRLWLLFKIYMGFLFFLKLNG